MLTMYTGKSPEFNLRNVVWLCLWRRSVLKLMKQHLHMTRSSKNFPSNQTTIFIMVLQKIKVTTIFVESDKIKVCKQGWPVMHMANTLTLRPWFGRWGPFRVFLPGVGVSSDHFVATGPLKGGDLGDCLAKLLPFLLLERVVQIKSLEFKNWRIIIF